LCHRHAYVVCASIVLYTRAPGVHFPSPPVHRRRRLPQDGPRGIGPVATFGSPTNKKVRVSALRRSKQPIVRGGGEAAPAAEGGSDSS
jgi:hypothetical protein